MARGTHDRPPGWWRRHPRPGGEPDAGDEARRAAALFERLVASAFNRLPARFREACGPLLVRVEPFADDETLDAMDIDDPYALLGLYHGTGLPFKSHTDVPLSPDVVTIYRKPVLAYAAEERLPVAQVVRHVLVHEIGHHFGFSDDDMEAIEASGDDDDDGPAAAR